MKKQGNDKRIEMATDHCRRDKVECNGTNPAPEISIGENENRAQPAVTEKDDQDLTPSFWLECDGDCDSGPIKDWSEGPIYLCLVCANVDLCQRCYEARQRRNRDGEGARSRTYCGRDHRYIKGPMAGWKGIKGGYMTIGDERTRFTDWLKDLKENQWKRAWERFWLREDTLQDIGI